MNIIGDNIRKLRKTAGLTQIEFAHKRFEVSLDWLLKGERKNSFSKTITALELSAKEIQLLKLIRQMKPKDQEELLQNAAFKMKQNK